MKTKLYIFGSFTKGWSHNKQVYQILSSSYDIEDYTFKPSRITGLKALLQYIQTHWNIGKSIPKESKVFVGFNSLYDVILLKLISLLYFKKFQIIYEAVVGQYDTYIINKAISKKFLSLLYYRCFFYFIDFFSFHCATKVIFDTNGNLERFKKIYLLNSNKLFTIPLGANNQEFKLSNKKLEDHFWNQNKLNILWYGVPSKLHQFEDIIKVLESLDPNKFQCTVISSKHSDQNTNNIIFQKIETMYDITIKELNEKLADSHLAFGCFGSTHKCRQVIINKEYEAFSTGTCVVTKKDDPFIFSDECMILGSSSNEFIQKLEALYTNRVQLKSIALKGYDVYGKNCSQEALTKSYTQVIG